MNDPERLLTSTQPELPKTNFDLSGQYLTNIQTLHRNLQPENVLPEALKTKQEPLKARFEQLLVDERIGIAGYEEKNNPLSGTGITRDTLALIVDVVSSDVKPGEAVALPTSAFAAKFEHLILNLGVDQSISAAKRPTELVALGISRALAHRLLPEDTEIAKMSPEKAKVYFDTKMKPVIESIEDTFAQVWLKKSNATIPNSQAERLQMFREQYVFKAKENTIRDILGYDIGRAVENFVQQFQLEQVTTLLTLQNQAIKELQAIGAGQTEQYLQYIKLLQVQFATHLREQLTTNTGETRKYMLGILSNVVGETNFFANYVASAEPLNEAHSTKYKDKSEWIKLQNHDSQMRSFVARALNLDVKDIVVARASQALLDILSRSDITSQLGPLVVPDKPNDLSLNDKHTRFIQEALPFLQTMYKR